MVKIGSTFYLREQIVVLMRLLGLYSVANAPV